MYCCNNPVNAVDEDGSLAETLQGVIAVLKEVAKGAFVGVVTYWIQCLISGEDVTKEGTFIAAISGGITGAFGGIAFQ